VHHHGSRRRCSFDITVPGDGPGDMPLCFWSDGDTDGYFGEADNDGGGCASETFDEQPDDNDGTDSVVIRLE
jgi:hypothetical protein